MVSKKTSSPPTTAPTTAKKAKVAKTDNTKTTPVETKQAAKSAPVETKQTTPVEEVVEPVDAAEDELAALSAAFHSKFQAVASGLASLRSEYRALEKAWTKTLKAANKAGAKKKRKAGQRQPSGFTKATLISKELAAFLEKPTGTLLARTDVTRNINDYIREHSLQDKDNGRQINPDKKLQSLLKMKDGEKLTYFNLQRYMSPHFAKAGQAAPAADLA